MHALRACHGVDGLAGLLSQPRVLVDARRPRDGSGFISGTSRPGRTRQLAQTGDAGGQPDFSTTYRRYFLKHRF